MEDPNATGFSQQFFNRVELDGNYFDGRWKPVVGINYSTIYRHDQDFPSLADSVSLQPRIPISTGGACRPTSRT